MQDLGYELPRIPITTQFVNKGRKKKEPGLRRSSPWSNGLDALLYGYWAASTSFLSRLMKYAGTVVNVMHARRRAWVSVSRHARRSVTTTWAVCLV
jgi:hypothetical protein